MEAPRTESRWRTKVSAAVKPGILALGTDFKCRHKSIKPASVPHDDDISLGRLPEITGIDRRSTRRALIVRSAEQHFARNVTSKRAASNRDNVPGSAFACPNLLAASERDNFRDIVSPRCSVLAALR